jgi:ABC-type sugar transport system ATPase subunit
VALKIDGMTLRGDFEGVFFVLRRGEVLGLFGFMGAGQMALGRCLFGASRADSGTVTLDGKRLHLSDTTAAVANAFFEVAESL